MINEQARPAVSPDSAVGRIRDEVLRRRRFLLTSHARPDGDSIGSQLAMAFALDALGKQVRIVNADAAPDHYQEFPGMDRIEIAGRVTPDVDAVIVMECSDLGALRRRGSRRSVPDQHRSPRRQPAVRRAELARRVGGGVRRDGVRSDPRPRRAAEPRDRDPHLPRDPHRHRVVPPLEHHAAHLRHLPAGRRGGREPGGDGAARVRQQQLRQAEADRRAPRCDGARSTTGASPCCTWTTRCSRRAAARTTTPKG